jgi:stress response protein SCP2
MKNVIQLIRRYKLMGVKLGKKGKVSLKKVAEAQKYIIGLGWKANSGGFLKWIMGSSTYDLDAACCLVSSAKNTREVIFYNHLTSDDGAVRHMGDNLVGGSGQTDDEQITIDCDSLDEYVHTIYVGVNIYNARLKGQSFKNVDNAYIRLVDAKTNTELCRYELSKGEYDDCVAVMMGRLVKTEEGWEFEALGNGITDKFTDIRKMFNDYN